MMNSKHKPAMRETFHGIKAEWPQDSRLQNRGRTKRTRPAKKKGSKKKTAIVPPLTIQLPNPQSPTFVQDTMRTLSHLRNLCKNCLKYVQQADSVLETLFSSANSLHETGLLQKLMQQRGKNLTANDWTTILLTLMNTPLGSSLLKKPGGDTPAGQKAPPSPQQLPPGRPM